MMSQQIGDLISREMALKECHDIVVDGERYRVIQEETLLGLPPVNQWIPVSERMPEDGTWNLFTDGKNVSVERYKADALDHFYPNGRWFSLDEAIAWMPLPEPYRTESEDE